MVHIDKVKKIYITQNYSLSRKTVNTRENFSSVHGCFAKLSTLKNTVSLCPLPSVLIPKASFSFGHVIGEIEGSGRSNYWMSVNHGYPVTCAKFLPAYLLMLRN